MVNTIRAEGLNAPSAPRRQHMLGTAWQKRAVAKKATDDPEAPHQWAKCVVEASSIWFPLVRPSKGHDYCDYFCCTLVAAQSCDPGCCKKAVVVELGDIVTHQQSTANFYVTLIWANKPTGKSATKIQSHMHPAPQCTPSKCSQELPHSWLAQTITKLQLLVGAC